MVLQRALSLILWGAGEQEEEEGRRQQEREAPYKPPAASEHHHQEQLEEGPTTPPLPLMHQQQQPPPSQPSQQQQPSPPAATASTEDEDEDELWSLPPDDDAGSDADAPMTPPPPLSPPPPSQLNLEETEEESAAFYSPLPYYRGPPRALGSPVSRALTLSRTLSAGGGLEGLDGLDAAAVAATGGGDGAGEGQEQEGTVAVLAPGRPPAPSCEMPPAFRDPITQEVMADPVTAADGHTYERAALHKWLEASEISPLAGRRMGRKNVRAHTFARALEEVKERMAALRCYVSWSTERIAYLEEEHDRLLQLRAQERRAAAVRERRLRWLEAETAAAAVPQPLLLAPAPASSSAVGVSVEDGPLTPLGRLLLRAARASAGALLEALAALGEASGADGAAMAVGGEGDGDDEDEAAARLVAAAASSPAAAAMLVALGRHLLAGAAPATDVGVKERDALANVLGVLRQWVGGPHAAAAIIPPLIQGAVCALLAEGLGQRERVGVAKACGELALGLLRWEEEHESVGGLLVAAGAAEAALGAVDGGGDHLHHHGGGDKDMGEEGSDLCVVALALLARLLGGPAAAGTAAYTRLRPLAPGPRVLAAVKRGMADPGVRREGCRALAALARCALGAGADDLLLLEGAEEAAEVGMEALRVGLEETGGCLTPDRELAVAVAALLGTLAAASSSSSSSSLSSVPSAAAARAATGGGYQEELLAAGAPSAWLALLQGWAQDAEVVRTALRGLVALAEAAAAQAKPDVLGRVLFPATCTAPAAAAAGDDHQQSQPPPALARRACRALLRFTPTDARVRRDGCAALALLLDHPGPFPPRPPPPSATGGPSAAAVAVVASRVLAAAAVGRRRAALLAELVAEGAARRLVEALLHCCVEAAEEQEDMKDDDDDDGAEGRRVLRAETVGLAARALAALARPPPAVAAAEDGDAVARRRRSLSMAGALPALVAVVEGRGVVSGGDGEDEDEVAVLRAMRAVVAAEAEEEAAVAAAGGAAAVCSQQQQQHRRLEALGRLARYAMGRVLFLPGGHDVSAPRPVAAAPVAAAAAAPPPAAAAAAMLLATTEPSSSPPTPPPLAPDHPVAVEALTLLLTLSQEPAAALAAPGVLAAAGLYSAWLGAVEARFQPIPASASLDEAALLGDFMAALVLAAPTSQASQAHARALLRAASGAGGGGGGGRSPVAVVAELMRRLVAADEAVAVAGSGAAAGGNPVLDGLRRLHSALTVAEVEGGEAGEEAGAVAPPLPFLAFSPSVGAFARRLLAVDDGGDAVAAASGTTATAGPPLPPRRAVSFSVLEAAAGLLLPPGPLPGPAAAVGSALGSVPALAWATVQATRRRFVAGGAGASE